MSPLARRTDAGDRLRSGLEFRLRLARAALLWEQAWPASFPAVAIATVFLVLALFDLLPRLPALAHAAVLVLLSAAFVFALARAFSRVHLPLRREAQRRLEIASALPHRPIETLEDRPAAPALTPAQRKLWEIHRARVRAQLRTVRVGWPAAGLARRDPLGLRVLLAIALLVAAADAGDEAGPRLLRALRPSLQTMFPPAALEAWVSPPDYTGLAPIVLVRPRGAPAGAGPPPAVPAGSDLIVQVHGGRGRPQLSLGATTVPFATVSAGDYRASAVLRDPARVRVTQSGFELAAWEIDVIADAPPSVELVEPPAATERAALRLVTRLRDDYGVTSAKAIIARPPPPAEETPADGAEEEHVELPLPLPAPPPREAEGTSYHDLTAHPWAGTEVRLRLEAADAAGQVGTSAPVSFVLPEREFRHEIARAIIAERKLLTIDPGSRQGVAAALAALTQAPERFNNDIVVYLAMRSAALRLVNDRSRAAIASVQSLMWDTALRLEDGGMALASRELRKAEDELDEALMRGAGDEEIARLMEKLGKAMDRFLDMLAREAAGTEAGVEPGEAEVLDRADLQALLEDARTMAEMGDREAARKLLNRLRDILENARAAPPPDAAAVREAREALDRLRDLAARQQELLERTYRNALAARQPPGPQGEAPPRPAADVAADAGEQEKLRAELGEAMLEMGDMLDRIPDPLGRAERAMREAAEALKGNAPGAAVAPQARALEELRQGVEGAARELAQRMQQPGGPGGAGTRPSPQARPHDPLGRPLPDLGGRGFGADDVRIPEAMEVKRARAILDELRRRAGDASRPAPERDYIERLLPRF